MIQKIVEDPDGSTAIELDEEGITYMMNGLIQLYDGEVGEFLTTPAVWTIPSPWWRFWDRAGEPVVGEFRLRRVA